MDLGIGGTTALVCGARRGLGHDCAARATAAAVSADEIRRRPLQPDPAGHAVLGSDEASDISAQNGLPGGGADGLVL